MARNRCMVPECPDRGVWVEYPTMQAAELAGRNHYLIEHYVPQPATEGATA